MKTLIIPDIHNKIEIADWIVGAEPADVVVYLGDYFDDFGDGPEDARRVAEWLNRTALRDDRVCLIGNHDVPYLFPATLKHTMCSGWSVAKAQAIKVTIDPGAVARMKLVYADGVPDSSIFSHAGMSNELVNNYYAAVREILDVEKMLIAGSDEAGKWLRAGWSRGGAQACGGITWCDWRYEFQPIKGVSQIVGHTPGREPRWKGENLCLDTHLKHYAVVENDEVAVRTVEMGVVCK